MKMALPAAEPAGPRTRREVIRSTISSNSLRGNKISAGFPSKVFRESYSPTHGRENWLPRIISGYRSSRQKVRQAASANTLLDALSTRGVTGFFA